MTYFDTKIQVYNSFITDEGNVVFSSKSRGELTLRDLLIKIKQPNLEDELFIDKIRREKNKQERDKLKTQLPGFLLSSFGTGKARSYDQIIKYTGLAVLDFDGDKVKSYAKELKEYLFNTYPFIIASFISPSGKVKCIVNLERANNKDEYKDLFRALEEHFDQYEGFDNSYTNAVLVTFYTYDKEILVRKDATIWRDKIKPTPKPIQNPLRGGENEPTNLELNQKRVYAIVSSGLNKIIDNGHPQLRSFSKMLGRFIASGYVNRVEAETWLYSVIENHPYLSKGIQGYKKTASHFIDLGLNEGPLALRE